MYKRARQAEITNETIINIPMRQMTVYEAELQHVEVSDNRAVATIRFRVASGTYIRSLAEELGRNLGYPACLQNLRRTKVGEYRIEDAYNLDDVK
jgi:tRNA pseudouridine55 synthase